MATQPDGNMETDSPKTPKTATAPPVSTSEAEDVESHTTMPRGESNGVESHTTAEGVGVPSIVKRWKKDVLMKKWSLGLHVSCLIFSFIALIIMASNNHGEWREFQKYDEYKYVLGVAVISTLYTGLQAFFMSYELYSGREIIPRKPKMMLDFIVDQLLAYLLISAASSALPLTNRMEEALDNDIFAERKDSIFVDSSVAAISMEFFAFLALALAALISGYKLCNQS